MSAVLTTEAIEAVLVEPLLESLRARGIRIPRPAEVSDYLTHYPDVIELAEKVCELTREEFDGSAELSLELYRDPEIDDQYLTLYVRPDVWDQVTWDKIERIHYGYELELADLSGWFLVMADFRAPESR